MDRTKSLNIVPPTERLQACPAAAIGLSIRTATCPSNAGTAYSKRIRLAACWDGRPGQDAFLAIRHCGSVHLPQ